MQTKVRESNEGGDPLEIVVDRRDFEVRAQFIGEHEAGILPGNPRLQPPLRLPCALAAQQPHHIEGRGERPALAVFGGHQVVVVAPIALQILLELLVNEYRAPGEVHPIPGQPENLSSPHSGEQGHEVYRLVRVALYGGDKTPGGLAVQRPQLLFEDAGLSLFLKLYSGEYDTA